MIPWSVEVKVWWLALCLVAVLNLAIWLRQFNRPMLLPGRRKQLWLSLVFVLGCGIRGIFPKADVQRIVLFDSWISSVFVGRSIATVAELSLMAQLAGYLRELAVESGSQPARMISYWIVPLIAVAETCSWYAVISTNYLGNTCEESIWTLCAGLLVIGFALVRTRVVGRLKSGLAWGCALGLGYMSFMLTVDVPMYFHRWRADEAAGRNYFSLGDGLRDVATRWVLTRSIEDWRTEMPWMALYFSIAVWVSLALIHAPGAKKESLVTLK